MTLTKRIGRYPVIREIGHGAMGTVFEGFDPDTGEKVAIKILRAEHLADSSADSASARFVREAQATRRLHHPNIVAVREYGEQGRIKFIAMEFLHERELRQLMRERGRFEFDDAVFVLLQLLDALGHSHQHGVVHRDIKPSNVIVLEGLQINVMDFGIARIESAALTQMGTLLGTPSYMSPEQMRGEAADGRADLWAAGVMLYEMLVGRGPSRPRPRSRWCRRRSCWSQCRPRRWCPVCRPASMHCFGGPWPGAAKTASRRRVNSRAS